MKPVTSVVSTRRKLATAIAAAGLLVGTLGHAWAASPEERLRDVENRIDQAEEELNHSSTALSEATAAYEAAVGALPAAETALANAQASHVAALDALRVAQAEVVAAKAADAAAAKALQEAIQKVEDQKVKIADVSDEIDDKRASASQIAATAYQQGGGNQLANMFAALQGESLSDVTSNTVAAHSVVAAESEIMSDLKNDRARLSNERVVLEFDSYGFHATRAAFDRDRRRDATLQRARYLVLRTTWTEPSPPIPASTSASSRFSARPTSCSLLARGQVTSASNVVADFKRRVFKSSSY